MPHTFVRLHLNAALLDRTRCYCSLPVHYEREVPYGSPRPLAFRLQASSYSGIIGCNPLFASSSLWSDCFSFNVGRGRPN